MRLLGALPDGSAALYGLNPEETGLDGLLVEWNGQPVLFLQFDLQHRPADHAFRLSLDDYDGDGADELGPPLPAPGTGTRRVVLAAGSL